MTTKRIYDDATRKAMAGLLPFAEGSYATAGLDCFDHLPEDVRPVFRIRDLSAQQLLRVRKATEEEMPGLMVEILQEGVMGPWENLVDSAFEEIAFSKEAIAKLPLRWLETLFNAALKLCSPNAVEREVLESSQPSTSESLSKAADVAAVPLA